LTTIYVHKYLTVLVDLS